MSDEKKITMYPIAVSGIELEVCRDIGKRQEYGMDHYKIGVMENPLTLRQWLNHAYEECLDQAIYMKRAIAELDKQASQASG